MANSQQSKEKPDPERVAILRSLPQEIKEQISGDEAEAFMYKRDLPESLLTKLQGYLVDDEQQDA
jgi:type II secretory pathway component PulC